MNTQADLFPIGTLATATGISPMTLRSWERRYGLLTPTRTAKGHRLYSATDIDTVERVLAYIKRGVSVGKVKALLKVTEQENIVDTQLSNWMQYLEAMLAATSEFNVNKLDSVYNEIISLYPIEVISTRLFLPLLKTFQVHGLAGYEGTVAEEHFLTTFIRNRLAGHFQQLAHISTGPELLFATLPSERHDFVLLLFAIHMMNAGYKVLSLGTNTPIDQILFAANKKMSQGIVTFGSLKPVDYRVIKSSQHKIFNMTHHGETKKPIITLDEDFSTALNTIRTSIGDALIKEKKND